MIRRPFAYITPAFAAAVAAVYTAGFAAAVFVPAAFLLLLWTFKVRNRALYKAVLLITASYVAGTGCFCLNETIHGHSMFNDGENVQVKGRVLQTDMKDGIGGTEHIQLRIEASGEKILVNFYCDEKASEATVAPVPGDIITVKGEVSFPKARSNPGCFDYSLYLKSTGIRVVIEAQHVELLQLKGRDTFLGRAYIIRTNFIKKLEKSAGKETAAMISGLMFGSEERMDEELLEEFRKNGTAHILAVSGLHMGIIYGLISKLWVWRKGMIYFFVAMMFLICYSAMASFSPSVVRAVIMIGIHIFSSVTNRRYDLCSAAMLAALAMLVKNPMSLYNTGFQMSFIAVLSLAMILPVIKRVYSGMLLGGIAIQAGLIPYIAYTFNYLSVGSILVNIPIIFIAGIILPVGISSMAAMAVCPGIFASEARLLELLCRVMTQINQASIIDGVTVFDVVSPNMGAMTFYYVSVIFFTSERGRLMVIRNGKKAASLMVTAALMIAVIAGAVFSNQFKSADVVFVDVGQGDCIHVRTEDGRNYLVDGGGRIGYSVGKKVLKPYLLKNGIKKADGIFITHLHTDHYKGAAELCMEGMADRLFIYEGNMILEEKIIKETGMKKEDISYIYMGQRVKLSEKAWVDIMWPERQDGRQYRDEQTDENETSLILKVTVAGHSVLITGDVDAECQSVLVKKWQDKLRCSVLKVAHHGSKYSYCEEFVKAADPGYAVFQVGKNSFGHPDEGVIENHRRKGIIVYRNDKNGAVAFDFKDGAAAEVMTVREDR